MDGQSKKQMLNSEFQKHLSIMCGPLNFGFLRTTHALNKCMDLPAYSITQKRIIKLSSLLLTVITTVFANIPYIILLSLSIAKKSFLKTTFTH